MSNFFRSLFGAKKAAKIVQVAKSKMQTRRLELIGLEERITPAATLAFGSGILSLTATSAEALTVSASGQVLTFTATGNITTSVAGSSGTGTSTVTVDLSNAAYAGSALNLISLNGASTAVNSTLTVNGALDLTAVTGTTSIGLSLLDGSDATADNDAFINFGVKTKGAGGVIVDVNNTGSLITIAALGDITTTTGAVSLGIASSAINTAGDVNTTSGAITYTGAVALVGGNVATNSTLAGGNLSIVGALNLNALNFTANQGLGNVTTISGGVTGSGALSLTGAAVTTVGVINTTGSVGATATTGDLTFSTAVTAASVNAKSTAGDVKFLSTVNTGLLGNFTSEATLGTKATQVAGLVTVGAGANALVTGNLVSTNTAAAITTSNVGAITITGNVDASVAGNDLALTAGTGAVTITGNVGSGPIAFGDLNANGTGSFLASGTVVANNINISQGSGSVFTTSVTFAKAVTANVLLTTDTGINVDAGVSGTITFSDAITVALGTGASATAATSIGQVDITSVAGAIKVVGNITGLDLVAIDSTSGAITLSGNVTTSGTNDTTGSFGDIFIGTGTSGNVLLSGNISTTGLGDIEIDNDGTGTITINGNVSTAAVNQTIGTNGDILIAADNTGAATGAGSVVIINGTVTTTGTIAGDIYIGVNGGTVAVNKVVSAGSTGNVVFITTLATDAITIASGANITAGDSVADVGAGILNLGANITAGTPAVATTSGIILNEARVNLIGAVSLKTGGTGTGADITLASVNGAQNLTLEAIDQITLTSVGQTTALNTVTVTNSAGVSSPTAFTAAKVVLSDTTGNVVFAGSTVITSSLTTAAKAYNLSFTGTSVLSGAPVFLNTGNVTFGAAGSTTSLTTGATITGTATSTVNLGGTIVSGGAFNIGALPVTTTIANATQLILNSTSAASTFAGKVVSAGTSANALSLLGVGTLTLSGDSSTTGVTGDINVINGTLNVTGKLGAASLSTATSGTITGAGGTIGNLSVNTGTVAPGGTLKTSNVSMNAATNYNAAVLTKTTASNLEIGSSNTVNLGGATLALSSVASGLAVGNSFTIINNTNSTAIIGTFAGLPQGSSVSAKDASGNTVAFTISYIGGTGANDVTLTVTSVTPSQTATPQPMVAGQPALNKFTAIGADAGGGPLVTITFPNGTYTSFFAYASTFTGGVRVALGDVNGDGSTDLITGAGPGGGPQVNVYNVNSATGAVSLQKSFFAFSAPSFTGGVYVAAGQTNGDAFADVIVGAGATGGSRVQVYAGSATGVVTTSTLNDFFAYSPAFTGGVVVAAGQRDAVAGDEVITAPASNGGYNIKSFNVNGTGNNPTVVDNFFAFNNNTAVGGLSLAVGYLNSGLIADLVVGTSNGGYGVILDSATSGIAGVPFAGFAGAIRAGVAEDSTGKDYAVALAGPTGGPRVSVFNVGATSLTETDNLFVMNPAFTGGLFGTPTLAFNLPA